jgi:hypothetical protein
MEWEGDSEREGGWQKKKEINARSKRLQNPHEGEQGIALCRLAGKAARRRCWYGLELGKQFQTKIWRCPNETAERCLRTGRRWEKTKSKVQRRSMGWKMHGVGISLRNR